MSHNLPVGDTGRRYIKEALDSGLQGEFTERLEKEFAAYFDTEYAVGVNTGTSALHVCLYAMGIGNGDEVIVPPVTMSAPSFAALYLGGVPVYADVNPDTFLIDPESVREQITPQTKAILPVHIYGLPCDMDPIMEIAAEHDLHVLEDCAECFLGEYEGKTAGTIGDMSIFSFERSKHMTSGEGGMVLTDDAELAERARKFSNLGYSTLRADGASVKSDTNRNEFQRPSFERHKLVGHNYRLPELCAAMVLAQLERLDELVERRRRIAELYEDAIEGCEWLTPQVVPDGRTNAYWTYTMRVAGVSWEEFREVFLDEGGHCFHGAWKLNYLEPALRGRSLGENGLTYEEGLCPTAERLQPTLIQLKTNYLDLDDAEAQARVLERTVERIETEVEPEATSPS